MGHVEDELSLVMSTEISIQSFWDLVIKFIVGDKLYIVSNELFWLLSYTSPQILNHISTLGQHLATL